MPSELHGIRNTEKIGRSGSSIGVHLGSSLTLKCFLALVILALTGSHPLLAQRQLFHEYASSDGLDNLNVRCLFQDETGFIWVGTDNGLFRYDGGHFQAFGHAEGLADTEILSIAQSPDGRLWIGTNSGISVMAGDHFKTVNLGDAESVTTIGFDANSTMYFERDSEIMRGMRTGDGSYSFRSIAQGEISGLSVKDQDIFFGKDGDLWHVRGDAIERFGSRMGLPSDMWGGDHPRYAWQPVGKEPDSPLRTAARAVTLRRSLGGDSGGDRYASLHRPPRKCLRHNHVEYRERCRCSANGNGCASRSACRPLWTDVDRPRRPVVVWYETVRGWCGRLGHGEWTRMDEERWPAP